MQIPVSPLVPIDPEEQRHDATALIALYDRSMDSMQGYAKMVEKAEPEFRETAERFRALHERHAGAVAQLLSEQGVTVDGDGTLMGTVNQTVITFRAFFDDIDEDVMDQVRSGEDWVLKTFDEAIDHAAGTDAVTADRLRTLRIELTDLLAETRHLG